MADIQNKYNAAGKICRVGSTALCGFAGASEGSGAAGCTHKRQAQLNRDARKENIAREEKSILPSETAQKLLPKGAKAGRNGMLFSKIAKGWSNCL